MRQIQGFSHSLGQVLTQQGLPSSVLPGVERRFALTAERLVADPVPMVKPSMEQALQWLLAHPQGA